MEIIFQARPLGRFRFRTIPKTTAYAEKIDCSVYPPARFFHYENFFQKKSIFREKSIDKRFFLWYNSVNKSRAGAPKRKGEKMLTYGVLENYKIKHVEQTDENVIKAYNRVDDILNRLDDDSADELIDAIGNYVFDCASADDKALIKSYKIRLKDAEIWYCHDND